MAGAEMSFWDHLDVLRGVLFRVVAVMLVLGIGAFAAMPWIFDNVIMAPCNPSFFTYRLFDRITGANITEGFHVDVVSLELASQFFTHMSAACWTALLAGFPLIMYFLWGFVSPALYEHEKKGVVGAFVSGTLLFYLGIIFSYFFVFPLALRFLSGYTISASIHSVLSLDSYMDNFFTMLILMGVVFELPVLAMLLGKIGILHRSFFSEYRRHAIVVLIVLAAIITPSDPFTLFMVFIPVYALWEFSARLVPAG